MRLYNRSELLVSTLESLAIGENLPSYQAAEEDLPTKAKIWAMAAISLDKTRGSLGQAMLECIWEVYKDGLIVYQLAPDGDEYNEKDILTWATDYLKEDIPYTQQIVGIVVNVIQDVHWRYMRNATFIDDYNEEITPERLIRTDGLISRLQAIEPAYTKCKKDEEKLELLNSVLYAKNRDTVRETAEKIADGKEKKVLSYLVSGDAEEGYSVTFDELTEEDLNFLEKKLGKNAEQRFA